MPRKKNPDAVHGGARKGAGRKGVMMTDTNAREEWKTHLTRALVQASSNLNTMKKGHFFTQREIRARWGMEALVEFRTWFDCRRHYDSEIADKLLNEVTMGRLSKEEYEKQLYTKAFRYVWFLRENMEVKAWQITRGVKKM